MPDAYDVFVSCLSLYDHVRCVKLFTHISLFFDPSLQSRIPAKPSFEFQLLLFRGVSFAGGSDLSC